MNKNGEQMRFDEGELKLLKEIYGGNDRLLKLLRKVFLPEVDPYAPIGQVIDLWMTIDVSNMTSDQAMIRLRARNEVITHIEQRFALFLQQQRGLIQQHHID